MMVFITFLVGFSNNQLEAFGPNGFVTWWSLFGGCCCFLSGLPVAEQHIEAPLTYKKTSLSEARMHSL